MGIFNLYPYTDFHELNADWIIKIVKELEFELKDFVKLNTIKYSDPIGWNITRQYEANTVVVDSATGNAYISSKPVPNGVIITDTNYWTKIYNYQRTIEKIESSIASYNGSEYAEKAYLKDSLIFYKDLLYKAMENINIGSQLLPDTNIQLITIEDVINTTKSDLQDVINTTKSDLQDVINTESNERKQADETINNKITLLDTDLTNVKNEVNQNHEELLDEISNREDADLQIKNEILPFTKPYRTIDSYGAIGDGTTDCSDILINAITDCLENGYILSSLGKNYKISKNITVPNSLIIDFNYGKLVGKNNTITIQSDIETGIHGGTLSNIRLNNIRILEEGYSCYLENIELENWTGTGITIKGGKVNNIRLNNYTSKNGTVGMLIDQSDVWVEHCSLQGATTAFILNGANIHLLDCTSWLNNNNDIANSIFIDNRGQNNSIVNCTCDTYKIMMKCLSDYLQVSFSSMNWIYNSNMATSITDLYLFDKDYPNANFIGDILVRASNLSSRNIHIGSSSQLTLKIIDGSFTEQIVKTLSGRAYGTIKYTPVGYEFHVGYSYSAGLPVGTNGEIDISNLYNISKYTKRQFNATYIASDGTTNICTVNFSGNKLVISGHAKTLTFIIINCLVS